VAFDQDVYHIQNIMTSNDVIKQTKLRLLPSQFNLYNYGDLFIDRSREPHGTYTMMVTSKFIESYYRINPAEAKNYIGEKVDMPIFMAYQDTVLPDVSQYLDQLYQLSDGSFVTSDESNPLLTPIRYMDIDIPYYCYDKDQISSESLTVCQQAIDGSTLFDSHDEYVAYIDLFKLQINNSAYFELLMRSNAVFYLEDIENPNYIADVYNYLYQELGASGGGLTRGLFFDKSQTVAFTITAILDNQHESILYMTAQNYNNLFQTSDNRIEFLNSFYTVHYNNKKVGSNIFEDINNRYFYDFQDGAFINHDPVEQREVCQATAIKYATPGEISLIKSVFYLNDYKACGTSNVASSYLNMFNWLFSIFFNVLMLASIVFYSMLIKVIFKARINEIGVFRSVGSTIKDIKQLFFFEVIYIFVTASVLTIGLIVALNIGLNKLFMNITTMSSRVLQFSGIHLLMNEELKLINISLINLLVQLIVVVTVILYVSNKSITHVVNTNPIDILREVV